MSEGLVLPLALVFSFGAGILSFLSPCVFPLVPSYLSLLGGLSEQNRSTSKGQLVFVSLSFVFGFSVIFIALSILSSIFFFFIGRISPWINLAAGIIIIGLGLNIIFDFLKFLNYEKRFHSGKRPRGIGGAFLAGMAFGAGWTPCIGPILAGILLMAGQKGQTGTAVLYLTAYSAGLGIPFLGAAVFFDYFLARRSGQGAAKFRKHLPLIQKISGLLLILIGILILTGRFHAINIFLQRAQYRYIAWSVDKAMPFRVLGNWLSWLLNIGLVQ
jgi:cytochrome c-type biogenesis protein